MKKIINKGNYLFYNDKLLRINNFILMKNLGFFLIFVSLAVMYNAIVLYNAGKLLVDISLMVSFALVITGWVFYKLALFTEDLTHIEQNKSNKYINRLYVYGMLFNFGAWILYLLLFVLPVSSEIFNFINIVIAFLWYISLFILLFSLFITNFKKIWSDMQKRIFVVVGLIVIFVILFCSQSYYISSITAQTIQDPFAYAFSYTNLAFVVLLLCSAWYLTVIIDVLVEKYNYSEGVPNIIEKVNFSWNELWVKILTFSLIGLNVTLFILGVIFPSESPAL